jgi:dipeptidyl aminopeptidase/acylaminoacyl peptidase
MCVHGPRFNVLCGWFARIGDVSSLEQVDAQFPLLQPCLNAGFAVVAYSVDGEMGDQFDDVPDEVYEKAERDAFQRLKASYMGLVNLRNAMNWVAEKVHQIDPQKLYVGGHGEAGSVALLAAAHEPKLKGCVVIDPVCDVAAYYNIRKDFEEVTITLLLQDTAFLAQCSPNCHTAQIACPIFLSSVSFDSEEDVLLSQIDSNIFSQQLTAAGKQVQYVKLGPAGDYQQNLNQAMQQGATWLKALSPASVAPVMP